MAQKGVLSRLLFDEEYEKLRIIALAEHSNELPRKSDVLVGAKGNAGMLLFCATTSPPGTPRLRT